MRINYIELGKNNYYDILSNRSNFKTNFKEDGSGEKFRISDLADRIAQFYGTAGVVIFGIGFISAALR